MWARRVFASISCDTYRITGLYSLPNVHCCNTYVVIQRADFILRPVNLKWITVYLNIFTMNAIYKRITVYYHHCSVKGRIRRYKYRFPINSRMAQKTSTLIMTFAIFIQTKPIFSKPLRTPHPVKHRCEGELLIYLRNYLFSSHITRTYPFFSFYVTISSVRLLYFFSTVAVSSVRREEYLLPLSCLAV